MFARFFQAGASELSKRFLYGMMMGAFIRFDEKTLFKDADFLYTTWASGGLYLLNAVLREQEPWPEGSEIEMVTALGYIAGMHLMESMQVAKAVFRLG